MARVGCAALFAVLAWLTPADLRSQAAGEYDVKGALIASFAKFIEWPPDAFDGPGSPLVVCVEGRVPLESGMAGVIDRSRAGGRSLLAQKFSPASRCHILFVAASDPGRVAEVMASIGDRTVTIGEQVRFLQWGGAIEFSPDGNRLQFEVNLAVIGAAKYRISSNVLSLARHSDPKDPRRNGPPPPPSSR